MKDNILIGIDQCLQNIGLNFSEEQMDLNAYIEDSISFIGFIVELEQYFNIEITDDYFSSGILNTINDVYNMVNELSSKDNTNS